MKTFESFISQSLGAVTGMLGGAAVGGPFGATIGAVGGLYGSEWLEEKTACECQSSKVITTVSSGMFAGISITFIAYLLYQPLSIIFTTLNL